MSQPSRISEHQVRTNHNQKNLGIGTFLLIVLIPSAFMLFIWYMHL
jgi:hypothetical protein